MVDYNIYINNGNENLGIEKKTITVGEVVRTAEISDVAEEINHKNPLVAEAASETVLEGSIDAVVKLLGMGFAVQYRNRNHDIIYRFVPDVEIKGGNIDLERAQELIPGTTEITTENAAELVAAAGVKLKVRIEVLKKFSEMLTDRSCNLLKVIERDKIMKKDNASGDTTIDTSTGSNNSGGDDIPSGNG